MLPSRKSLVAVQRACSMVEKADEADSNGIVVSRRNVIALAIAGAASLAFGAAPALAVGGGTYGDENGYAHQGNYVGWAGDWRDWEINNPSSGAAYQRLRVALKIEIKCDWCNELYDHMESHPYVACGDLNERNPSKGLWLTETGDDNFGYIYRDGTQWSIFYGNLINDDVWWPSADHYGDYRDYAYAVPTWWSRRAKNDVPHAYQAKLDIYNYYYYGSWPYTQSNPGQSIWSPSLRFRHKAIALRDRWTEFGKIVRIVPHADRSKCLDASGSGAAQVQSLRDTTAQHWLVLPGAVDDTNDCHLHKFAPVHVREHRKMLFAQGAVLNKPEMGRIYTAAAAADDDSKACEFWLHDVNGIDYLVNDASGNSLDRYSAGIEDGTACDFHSSGKCGEWDNAAHQWHVEEACFEGSVALRTGRGLLYPSPTLYPSGEAYPRGIEVSDRLYPGCPAIATNPAKTCIPVDDLGTGSVEYRYRFYVGEQDDALPADGAVVMGAAMRRDWNEMHEVPAYQYVGLAWEYQEMTDFRLRLDGSAFPGSIKYATRGLDGSIAEGADGSFMSGGSRTRSLCEAKVWLEGKISRHYDVDYRFFNSNTGWSDHVYSSGKDNAPWAGDGVNQARAMQVRLVRKPLDAAVVQEFSTKNVFVPGREEADKKVWCGVELALNSIVRSIDQKYPTDKYKGLVLSPMATVANMVHVSYFADGESKPCFEDDPIIGDPYTPPQAAFDAGSKDGCTRFEGWYLDPEYKTPFVSGTPLDDDTSLYGRNICTVSYTHAATSYLKDATAPLYLDEGLSVAVSPESMLFPSAEYAYGEQFEVQTQSDVFAAAAGKVRRIGFIGVFADKAAEGNSLSTVSVYGDAVLYMRWSLYGYDGIIAGW